VTAALPAHDIPPVACLRAALVTPLTGPLARYGTAGAIALRLWAERVGARIAVYDAHPDALRALREAEATHPDLIFGPYGSGPTATVVAASSRLLWNHGGAGMPAARQVVNVLAPATSYWHGALRATSAADAGARRVAVLHTASGFGTAVGVGAARAAADLGLAVVRRALPTADPADADVTSADVLLVAGGFAEERQAADTLLPGHWRVAGFVGAGVEEVLSGLGLRRDGLLGPAQWLAAAAPTPDEGPTSEAFVAAYRRAAGTEPAYPAAQAFAAGVVAARCVRDARSTADDDLRAAADALTCTTMFGRFRLDAATGEQVGHEVLTVQWQDGQRSVIWPPAQAQAALRLRSPA
jgi:branched-chain amino acid transport system substrate-binding protein